MQSYGHGRESGQRELADVVRLVARAFYEPETIVVLDGLLHLTGETSIHDEDLAKQLKMNHRVVRSVLGKLKTDLLVKSFERKEQKGIKEVQQQYWRIDAKQLLDATKLRIHKMKTMLEGLAPEKSTVYVCNECEDNEGRHPKWDEFDVQALLDPLTCAFCCKRQYRPP